MRTTPREEAQQRIHELVAELAEIVGPNEDGQAEWEPGEEPSGTLTLWDWVVVGCWVDDNRKSWLSVTPAAGMIHHHTIGLLHDALAYGEG